MVEYEVLSRVTKKDYTSLVALICCVEGKCCIIPKESVSNYKYSNAKIGVNGKVYARRGIYGPVTSDMVVESEVVGVSRSEVIRLLIRLRDSRS